jgi:hypothetical protein
LGREGEFLKSISSRIFPYFSREEVPHPGKLLLLLRQRRRAHPQVDFPRVFCPFSAAMHLTDSNSGDFPFHHFFNNTPFLGRECEFLKTILAIFFSNCGCVLVFSEYIFTLNDLKPVQGFSEEPAATALTQVLNLSVEGKSHIQECHLCSSV